MLLIVQAVALIAYFVGIFLAILTLRTPSEANKRGSTVMFVAAWILQGACIVGAAAQTGGVPLRNLDEFLALLSWGVTTLYLGMWFRSQIQTTSLILPPIAFVTALLGIVIPAPTKVIPDVQQQGWFFFHTIVVTLGLAVLSVAFAMSVIYLVQERAIKSKKPLALLERLPSLDTSDHLGFLALIWGFALMTIGIATGLVLNMVRHHTYWVGGHKQTVAILAWLVFALLFYARIVRGLRGRRSAYLMITGFALGMISIIGLVR